MHDDHDDGLKTRDNQSETFTRICLNFRSTVLTVYYFAETGYDIRIVLTVNYGEKAS